MVAPEVRFVITDGPAVVPGRFDAVPYESAVVLDGCVVAPDEYAAVPDEGFVEAPDVGVAAIGGLALESHDGVLVVAPG